MEKLVPGFVFISGKQSFFIPSIIPFPSSSCIVRQVLLSEVLEMPLQQQENSALSAMPHAQLHVLLPISLNCMLPSLLLHLCIPL